MKPFFSLAILGGAGPLVCARVQLELLARFQRQTGARSDEEFPSVFSFNTAIAGVGPGGLEDLERAAKAMWRLAEMTKSAGAQAALVPCASVHPALLEGFPLPVVDWLGAAARSLAATHTTVGVMGSRSSRRDGVFRSPLLAAGARVLELDDEHQALADAIIEEAMTGSVKPATQEQVQACEAFLRQRGAGVTWWGCTEFSFVPSSWALGEVLEPLEAMTTPVLEAWLGEKA